MNQETNVQEARVRQPWTAQRVGDILLNNALLIIMAIAVVYIAIKNPNFIKPASLINILSQTAAYLPAALGIGGCIVLTGTDLSAGRAVGITACISASLLQNAANMANKMWPQIGTLPIPVVIVLAMLIGAAIGCFNGFFVAKFKLHPFIVTLGTQLILYTVLLLYVQQGNNKGMAISNLDPSYTGFVKGSLFSIGGTPIPNYVLFAIVLTAVMWFVWNKTTFGKNMFALGSNEEAARVSGVNVFGVTVGVFALAGAMYGFTGFIEGARIGSNTANTGLNYELDAIAACVIGGVSFVGGIGKIRGIVIGVVMLRLIFVGLTMVGVPQDLQYLIKGLHQLCIGLGQCLNIHNAPLGCFCCRNSCFVKRICILLQQFISHIGHCILRLCCSLCMLQSQCYHHLILPQRDGIHQCRLNLFHHHCIVILDQADLWCGLHGNHTAQFQVMQSFASKVKDGDGSDPEEQTRAQFVFAF